MKERRFSIHADEQIVICDWHNLRETIVDIQMRFGNGKTFLVEHHPGPYSDSWGDKEILDRWHVFAHDGYHLIEVVEVT